MKSACPIFCALVLVTLTRVADGAGPTAAEVSGALRDISVDPNETYYVRDIQLDRAGVKFFLTEGVLSFATPIAGRRIAAVFTTAEVEAGDAEVLAMPPRRSERASLASFAKTPNLDEHFQLATFVFSDDTVREVMNQINERPVHRAPEFASRLGPVVNHVLRDETGRLDLRLTQSLLDQHSPEKGFFYSLIAAPRLGSFAVLCEPAAFEPVTIGRPPETNSDTPFKLWTAFRPKNGPHYMAPLPRIHSYAIESTILPDLSMTVKARFDMDPSAEDGRVLPFILSDRMTISRATIDGERAEIMQRGVHSDPFSSGAFLLTPAEPLPNKPHQIELEYRGTVIRQVEPGAYFVDERNAWYPQNGTTHANFDLTFRIPQNLRLVSTGESVGESMDGEVRVVHRRTSVPESMAGFNLGSYQVTGSQAGGYDVECYSPGGGHDQLQNVAEQTSGILDFFSKRWGKLPIRSVAVSPIPGYFGQGFPGLIYLSSVSYLREQDRPAELRSSSMDAFFSEVLLPHEVAHQWWGNLIAPADYRSEWLIEAMANDGALQFLQSKEGPGALVPILDRYRSNLLRPQNGHSIESAGPVDFGFRLMENEDLFTWHAITYDKGTWILRMLRERLGDDGFLRMQVRMLQEFSSKPFTNEDFRRVASEFVPPGAPDRDLSLFFDTWIYGTGIPELNIENGPQGSLLDLSGTTDDFTVDVPLRCRDASRSREVFVRASSGSQSIRRTSKSEVCRLPSPSDFLYVQIAKE